MRCQCKELCIACVGLTVISPSAVEVSQRHCTRYYLNFAVLMNLALWFHFYAAEMLHAFEKKKKKDFSESKTVKWTYFNVSVKLGCTAFFVAYHLEKILIPSFILHSTASVQK